MKPIGELELEAAHSQFTRAFGLTVFSFLALQVLTLCTNMAGDSVRPLLGVVLLLGIAGVIGLYIYFLVSIHRLAMAMDFGLWAIFLAVVSIVPLLGILIGIGLLFASGRAVRAAA